MDHFSSGRHLPECELSLRLLPNKPLTSFEHDIELQGTADHQYFTLEDTGMSFNGLNSVLNRFSILIICTKNLHLTDIFSGSESETPCSSSAKQSGGNTLQQSGECFLTFHNTVATCTCNSNDQSHTSKIIQYIYRSKNHFGMVTSAITTLEISCSPKFS